MPTCWFFFFYTFFSKVAIPRNIAKIAILRLAIHLIFFKIVALPKSGYTTKKWLYISWLYFVNGYTFVFPHQNW